MTLATLGYGTLFQTGDGNSPESFTTFAEVVGITLPPIAIDSIDLSHELPPGSTREAIPGLVSSGELQLTFNLIPANAAALMIEIATRVTRNRKVVLPNGLTWQFAAFLTGFESTESVGEHLSGTAKFQITGATTLG